MTLIKELKTMRIEDTECILENFWETEEEDALHKMFLKQIGRGMLFFLRHSKEQLKELSYVESDGSIVKLQTYEINKVRMLHHYWNHLQEKGMVPDDQEFFRFNSITRLD